MKPAAIFAATALAASLCATSTADAIDRARPVKVFILAGRRARSQNDRFLTSHASRRNRTTGILAGPGQTGMSALLGCQ